MNDLAQTPRREDLTPPDVGSRLDKHERELLAEVVESSLRVVQRHQFFGWTQGIVQALLPHEILLCGVEDVGRPGFTMQYFSASRYFHDDHFGAVSSAKDGLMQRLMAEWQITGEPFVLSKSVPCCEGHAPLVEQVETNELKNLVAHGVRGGAGRGLVGFYGFSRVSSELGRGISYRAELIVPYLHATYMRVLAHESKSSGNGARTQRQITGREAEILKWIKEGKTNIEIARALELSPWTVKNHVQTILKKLSAQTRGHAVARAISLGILDSGD
jgi:transcriptional regulator EpsA